MPNAESEIGDTLGNAHARRKEREKAASLQPRVMFMTPGLLHESLPLSHSLHPQLQLTGSQPGSFRSPQRRSRCRGGKQSHRGKRPRCPRVPRDSACWLPGPPAIVTSVPRRSVSIHGPPSAPLPPPPPPTPPQRPTGRLLWLIPPPRGGKCPGHGWKPVALCQNC